jgi:diguanylate cyclase (GGDEF)-like protein/PAS domain S-box-containing protein
MLPILGAMGNPRSLGRLAWVGLAVVLVFLASFSVFVASTTHAAADGVRQSTSESNAYEAARFTVAEEESLEREYLLQPSLEIRAKHAAAAGELVDQLTLASSLTDEADDVAVIQDILAAHVGYLDVESRLFDAVDANDMPLIVLIDQQQADPQFDAIEERVDDLAAASRAEASLDLATLNNLERLVLTTTPIVFLVGLALMIVFWIVLGSFQRHLDQTTARFRSLVENASDVVTILRADGTIVYASEAAEQVWGIAPAALIGTACFARVHPDDLAAARAHLADAIKQPATNIATELRLQRGDGSWRDSRVVARNLLHQSSVAGVVVTWGDITERKQFEQDLKHLAFHDPLTGLPNRALFTDRLERALAHADRDFRSAAVLFVNVDNFKVINDSLGHQQGDALLAEVAMRIRRGVRAEDTVARLGADEFTVLLEDTTTQDDATEMADRVVEVLSQSIALPGREVFITISVGVALSAPRHDTPDSVLRNADLAMHRAKSDGKARVAVFDRSMEARAVERMDVETEMRSALDRGEFEVFYQPIFSLADEHIDEFEALVRWRKPDGTLVMPASFIPIAEETGLIVPLGQWVLDQACGQTRRWQARYPADPPLGISVNLSARQFENPHLIRDIQNTLAATGLDPRSLKLEITESVAMQDPDATALTLRGLKTLGVRMALDDFGTGYSSLSYLKRFPVDTLKIDRSFVDGLGHDSQDTAIVQSVIALARALNLTTTGEGIETASQQAHLRTLGCSAGQGYLFARPAPAREVDALLKASAELPRAA